MNNKFMSHRYSRRRYLSVDQELEVIRLYRDTPMPVKEICRQFNLKSSSHITRLVKEHGVSLRSKS